MKQQLNKNKTEGFQKDAYRRWFVLMEIEDQKEEKLVHKFFLRFIANISGWGI